MIKIALLSILLLTAALGANVILKIAAPERIRAKHVGPSNNPRMEVVERHRGNDRPRYFIIRDSKTGVEYLLTDFGVVRMP